MEQAQSASRSRRTSRRNNNSRPFEHEAPAQPTFYAEDRRLADEHAAARNGPLAQVGVAINPNDGSLPDTFVFTLYHKMLRDQRLCAYIHWNETGDAFVIPDIERFKQYALGSYFDCEYDGFHRNLNGYGFKKLERNKSIATWRHRGNLFLRDSPHLLPEIKRVGTRLEQPLQQSQSASNTSASSNAASSSQPTTLLDDEPDAYDPEQEIALLKTKLREREEAHQTLEWHLGNLETRYTGLAALYGILERRNADLESQNMDLKLQHASMEGRLSQTEMIVRSLVGMLPSSSPRRQTPPGTSDHTAKTPPSTSVNLPNGAQANCPTTNAEPTHMRHITMDDVTRGATFGNQSIPGGSRPSGDFSRPHQAMPAATLPPPNPPPRVGPSSMPSGNEFSGLQTCDSFPFSHIATHEQANRGSWPENNHQMAVDDDIFNTAAIQHTGFTPPSRSSPRPLRTGTAVVHRRDPATDQDTRVPNSNAFLGTWWWNSLQ